VLLAHAVGCRRIDLYGLRHEEVATPDVRQTYRDLIRKRLEGCPVAYLVGRKEFLRPGADGLPGRADPAARHGARRHGVPDAGQEATTGRASPTSAPARGRSRSRSPGTTPGGGDGHRPERGGPGGPPAGMPRSTASPTALRFVQGDLFSALAAGETFDLVASNPPYIAAEDLSRLPPGVKGLRAAPGARWGAGGFVVFDRLIAEARTRLIPGGHLLLEIGSAQELPAREKLAARGDYELAPTVHDYSGHPRVLIARAC